MHLFIIVHSFALQKLDAFSSYSDKIYYLFWDHKLIESYEQTYGIIFFLISGNDKTFQIT